MLQILFFILLLTPSHLLAIEIAVTHSIEEWICPGVCIVMHVPVSDSIVQGFGRDLAEDLSRDANLEGKGSFSLKRYICRNKSSLEFLMIFLLFSVPGYF